MLAEVVFAIIGWIIGFASSYLMWKVQTRYEQKNIARALYLELSSLEEQLRAFTGAFTNPPPGANRDTPMKINQPFYTEGLFFSFRKEISTFNDELSNGLYQFYIHLLRAEESRQVGETDMFFKPANDAMKDDIIKAYGLLPDLEKLLEKEFKGYL